MAPKEKTEDAEKKEEDVEMKTDEAAPMEVEKPNEPEEDAPVDKRKQISDAVGFNLADSTLNVMPTTCNRMLTCLNDGGLQYLLASVRATVGIKKGRYMFECQIVENLSPAEQQSGSRLAPQPKQLVRLGFSLGGSSIFLGDTEDSVCFDSEGNYTSNKKKSRGGQRFGRESVAALVLNLNSNTVSLFVNGQRASQPQELPENMVGKTLYPTITYRNVTLRMNFGPAQIAPLPFRCRMLQEAAEADVDVAYGGKPAYGAYGR